ncbi:hypothetical protein DH2020_012148 [Rehmannia glutinosa]|uniref:Pentatricopeptide repeat-containing protein n=1 Tax=Rehmannia glutinosa TaxID=99300 RepID=A0ABR0XFD9_REHGL
MNNLYEEIIGFYKFIRRRFLVLDNMVFLIVLKACAELRDFGEGRKLHGHIVHMGSPDSFVLTGLVDMYAKCGEITTARKVLKGFGIGMWALHQGKWVHGNVIKNGIEVNSYLFSSIVDMYIKCGAIHDARLIFDEFRIIDLVSWTAMIMGYAQSGFAENALLLFTDKKWQEVYPNSVTLASVLSACAQSGNHYLGSSVHSLGIKLGHNDVNVMNALVDMYAKCRRIEDAVYLFESMLDKDVVAWNSIISVTVVAVLSACACLGDIRFGSSLHAYSIREGFSASSSVYIGTAVLNLYAKCGDANSARTVFDEMAEKNAVTWSAMIGGYGKQGNSNECLELFSDMLKENVEPTDIIFTTILSACSHTGMITEGWRYFDKMCKAYNFIPSMRHYVCMVDLLARSGTLEEALEFIEKMPVQPDCAVFGSFLHGCSLHSRFDLGDHVVRKMLELHPDDAGHYMLMSNFNASKGRWSQAGQLRDLMKRKGFRKQLGCSQVDLYTNEMYSQRAATFG